MYTYVIVRSDLVIGSMFSQFGHACLIASQKFNIPGHTNIVSCKVASQYGLFKIADKLDSLGIKYHIFYEPDLEQYTSICTEAIEADKRFALRGLKLI